MSCHWGRVERNCCCNVWYNRTLGGGGGGTAIAVIGSLTSLSIGSKGVTGGPMNSSRVGMVGENFALFVCT